MAVAYTIVSVCLHGMPWNKGCAACNRTGELVEPLPRVPDYEEMRKERGWPTPNHMRRAADALDILTPAKYGDVLRWFADLADEALEARTKP